MKFRINSLDEMNEAKALLGEPAVKKLERADMTIIDISVLRRLLLMAGFTQAEIERAQSIGTTSALTQKIMRQQSSLPFSPTIRMRLETNHYPSDKPITSKRELMDWLIKGFHAYRKVPARPGSHQRRLVFSCVGNGGAELSESFWEQLEAQNADPDTKE